MHSIVGFFNILASIATLVASIQFLNKFRESEAYLMLIGSIISVLSTIVYIVVIPFVSSFESDPSFLYSPLMLSLGTIGHLMFAVGFFMLIQKLISRKND
jgi:mannose/fructose/N-acetylgalactosamine-specific phosphotransferase system component IIC